MTKQDLIINISKHFSDLTIPKVNQAVKAILTLMTDTLKEGGRIEVRGFGSFNTYIAPAKTCHNPKNGEPVYVEKKIKVHFKPGRELRYRVNGGKY